MATPKPTLVSIPRRVEGLPILKILDTSCFICVRMTQVSIPRRVEGLPILDEAQVEALREKD